jgi:hypothetical protein
VFQQSLVGDGCFQQRLIAGEGFVISAGSVGEIGKDTVKFWARSASTDGSGNHQRGLIESICPDGMLRPSD